MRRGQLAGWLAALVAGSLCGLLLAMRDTRPQRPAPDEPPFNPEVGWTTTTDPDGW